VEDTVSEGYIYQRGPEGQVPKGQSIDGAEGAFGTIPLDGQPFNEHVTVYGEGWHRSWDNPGPKKDHSTNQVTGEIIQHPH
jgi:hypothetical protein